MKRRKWLVICETKHGEIVTLAGYGNDEQEANTSATKGVLGLAEVLEIRPHGRGTTRMGDSIYSVKIEVIVQENGIIRRASDGYYIGRLSPDMSFDEATGHDSE